MRNYQGHARGHAGLTSGFLGLLLAIAFFLADNGFFGDVAIPYDVLAMVFAGFIALLSFILIGNGLKRPGY